MKKIALLLSIVLILTCCLSIFCGCEGKAERDYKSSVNAAKLASDTARKAENDYNDLSNRLNNLQDAYDRLK